MAKSKKGFTIIEVVLVLAIAGLIFLMVFIALPALQRSQRNTRRRQDMARILSAINDYQSNNNGKSPVWVSGSSVTADPLFVPRYIDETCDDGTSKGGTVFSVTYAYSCSGDQFVDPDGTNYTMTYDRYSDNGTGANIGYLGSWFQIEDMIREHKIFLTAQSKCTGNESSPTTRVKGEGNISIVYALEGGAIYCGDNS
jgi:prepilin-type N-terminal cleavage/methylation domain-containing protein